MNLFMSEDEAREYGFTHHGSIFSVQCWVTDAALDPQGYPMVATKFAPAEVWVSLCTAVLQTLACIGVPLGFTITMGAPIDHSA